MIDNVRKYKLCLTNSISYGLSSSGTSTICNMLNSFTTQNNERNYSNITEECLSNINVPEFKQRVCDFLKYVNIESSECRDKLLEESSYYNPDFEFICKLNSEFIVYKFFDGVRVINVGESVGTLEYKTYLFGDNPDNYNWQTNPTFLGLNLNEIYVFEVRDVYQGQEMCKVSRTIPLDTLVLSTTQSLRQIEISLEDTTSCACYCDSIYGSGNLLAQPNLNFGERICVEFELNLESSANGVSCAEIFCEKNGTNPSELICSVNSVGLSPVSGSFIICENDNITYNLFTNNSSPGDCSCSYIRITGVDGLNSTNPSIDLGNCCVSITDTVPVTDVVVFLQECNVTSNENNGEVKIAPLISTGKYIDVDILTRASACICSTSEVTLICKPSGGVWNNIFTSNNTNPQPQSTTVRMLSGDRLCYSIVVNATEPGSCAEASIELTNTTSSSGVDSYIDYNYYTDIITKDILPTTATVSLCRHNFSETNSSQCANGYINVTPSLSYIQNIIIDIDTLVLCMGLNFSDACAQIFCKSAGGSSFIEVLSINPTDYNDNTNPQSNNIIYYSGDQLCYNIYAEAFCGGGVAQSDIVLDKVTGNCGVYPYINSTISKRCDEVYGLYYDQYGNLLATPIGIGNIN